MRNPSRSLALIWVGIALAVAYATAVYFNEFVALDDGLLITKNVIVKAFNFATVWRAFTMYDPELYIPFTFLSYQITHAFFGLNPIPYHFGNLVLHALSVVGVMLILERLTKERWVVFLGTIIFALHPIQAETVLWAAARKDALASCFGIFALLCALRGSDGKRHFGWLASIVLFTCALLSKVSVITLPFVFLAIEWWRGRLRELPKKPLLIQLALCVVFGVIAIAGKSRNLSSTTPFETASLAAKSTLWYLSKFFIPQGFSVVYPENRPVFFTQPWVMLGFACVLGLLIAAWVFRKKVPAISAGILAMGFFLVPNETNFLKNGFLFFASDRYFYLASLGIIPLVAAGIVWIVDRFVPQKRDLALWITAGVLTLGFTTLTFRQAQTWRTSETMYQNVLKNFEESALAWNNIGNLWMKANKTEDAERAFRRALAIDPTQMSANINMGDLERQRGHYAESEKYLLEAKKTIDTKSYVNMEELAPYYFLGQLYDEMGEREKAREMFILAVKKAPTYADPNYNLAVQLEKMGRKDEAVVAFAQTIAISPTYLDARYHLANILAEKGLIEEAAYQLEQIVKYVPNYEKAAEHLAKLKLIIGS